MALVKHLLIKFHGMNDRRAKIMIAVAEEKVQNKTFQATNQDIHSMADPLQGSEFPASSRACITSSQIA